MKSDPARWTGPRDEDLVPGTHDVLRLPGVEVPGERWPYGDPVDHDPGCYLHLGGSFCDCEASASE